jgi:hypothetical protein
VRLSDLAKRFDMLTPRLEHSVLVIGADAEAIRSAYPAIDAALRQRMGYRLILAGPPSELAHLRQLFPHETVSPVPTSLAPRCLAARTRAAVIVTIGDHAPVKAAAHSIHVHVRNPAELSSEALVAAIPALPSAKAVSCPSPIASKLVAAAAGRPIRDLADLAARLRSPRAILCVGNGPSSEDPRLSSLEFDCLFRVNWTWRTRNILTKPDMVFTADPDLPDRGAILGFPSEAVGIPIILRHILLLRPSRAGYVFLDEILDRPRQAAERILPTNGAVMISAAAALRPERLMIAGIDLYEHPEGRYPGDAVAADGYAREHSRAVDLAHIRSALGTYRGELVIVSKALRRALAEDYYVP